MSITKAHIDKKKAFLRNLKEKYGTVYLGAPNPNSAHTLALGIDEETRQFLIERLSKQLKHDVEQYTRDLKEEVNKLIG
jgi:hypothetical protein